MIIDKTNQKTDIVQYITPKEPTCGLSCLSDMKIKLQEIIENLTSPKSAKEPDLADRINDKFLDLDFAAEFDIDAAKIGVNDAIFFVNLLNSNNIINYSVENNSITLKNNEKAMGVTNSLLKVLENSYNTNKPLRLDFDKDVTVIIKLDREGKVQAHFIPGNSEVENYLKNNIPSLRQKFEEEKINYSYLGYKGSKKQKRREK